MGKKKETASQVEERRRKGRVKAQKYRDRIKNNPDFNVLQKLAEAERYKKRVAEGKLKPIAEKSAREQRNQRKHWKRNSANFRNKNTNVEDANNNTPSLNPMVDPSISSGSQGSRVQCGRKRVKRDRSKVYRALRQSAKELKAANRTADRYKKRYQRLKTALKTPTAGTTPSPRSKVITLLKGKKVGKDVVRRLVFGESIISQLKEKYLNTHINFHKTIGTKYLSKYRMMKAAREFYKQQRVRVEKKKVGAITDAMRQQVISFLQEDENSRMSPGKKDCVTRKGTKKQKRLLNYSMLELHQKFVSETSQKISYSSFCRLRPFWVLQPTVGDRETCTCMIHDNMQFKVGKAYNLKMITVKSADDLPQLFCCDIITEDCLLRKCKSCLSKNISIPLGGGEEPVQYFQWATSTETRSAHGKTFDVKITTKKSITSTKDELINAINKVSNERFLRHLCNIRHQYKAIKSLKENLKEDGAIVHVDFSENYMCKYASETQAVHFGASHRQITLHTGLYYYLDTETKVIKCQSFCTVSENNRHDARAIWAHLTPILLQIATIVPKLKILHFVSDSPSTQYRNKTMFMLFTRFLNTIIPIDMASWNYCEAGHGKGAADGVGGVIKRTADKLVLQGNDITDSVTLLKLLEPKCPGVILIPIKDESISSVDSKVPPTIKMIPGTMQVHQVTWHSSNLGELNIRSLSCFKCPFNETCREYGLPPFQPIHFGELAVCQNELAEELVISPDSRLPTSDSRDPLAEHRLISVGQWVAVIFNEMWYPGKLV